MKFGPGDKVRVVRLLDKFTNEKYLDKVGRIMKVDKTGYHVLLDDWFEEATFVEDELEPV